MATLQLNLPKRLMEIAQERASAAGFDSVDQYIASLIEDDRGEPISQELAAQLIAGLESGPSVEVTREFLSRLKERAHKKRRNTN